MKMIPTLLAIALPLLSIGQKGSTTTSSSSAASSAAASSAFIDVTGTTEIEVEPDIFYAVFMLKEKTENKVKVSVREQVDKIKFQLQNSGVSIEDFLLEKEGSDEIKVLPVKKQDPAPQYFIIKIEEADNVRQIFKTLDSLGGNDIHLTEVGYSKEAEVEKQLRIDAVKQAKEKSDYMLAELGATTGKPIYVYEDGHDVYYGDGPQFRRYAYSGMDGAADGGPKAKASAGGVGVSNISLAGKRKVNELTKIKYEYIVVVRFEIK